MSARRQDRRQPERTLAETAALLRQLVAMTYSGELAADSGQARAIVRQMEGAIVALEAAGRTPST